MGLPKDLSGSPEEFQADDFGHRENFSASLTSAMKCREREDISIEDLLCLSAVENRLENTDISDKDVVSEIPPSMEDDCLKKEDASDKADISVEKTLPISKVTQPLSGMNAKRRYDSKEEKTKPKAKRVRKNVFYLLSTSGEKEDCSDIPPSTPGDLLQKVTVSGENVISDIPPTTPGDLLEKEDVSDKSLTSDVPLKNISVIPKPIPDSSAKNTKDKYDSEKAKRQRKNIIPAIRPSPAKDHFLKEGISDKNITSDIPPSTAGNHFEKDDLSDDDDISRFPLKNLRIPKVARRLSVKNAKRKYDSQKEKTNLKAKRQRKRILKDLSFDSDFLSRECFSSSRRSGKQDSKETKHDSDSDSSSPPPPAGPFECKICQRLYVHEKSLKRHMKTHSQNEELFQCQKCDAAFRQACDLKKHERLHDGVRPYSCNECDASFTQLSALNRHAKIHTDEKGFSCGDCGKRFIQSSSLKRHENCHKQTKTFMCKFCETMFSEKHHLDSHVNSMHRDEADHKPEEFACEVCSKVFFRYSNYWTHKKGHDKDTRNAYKCEKCNVTFSTKSNLNRHCNFKHEKVPNSDVEKPYPCNVCDERFSRNVSLKLHMRFHDTSDVHRCNVCPKTFTAKIWLRKHLALHTNNGLQCEQCLRIFRSHFRLNLHRRQMGGKCVGPVAITEHRKYACKYCNAKLSLRTRLAKHVRKAHPEVQAFLCDVCEKGFCYYLDFLSHRKTHRYIPYQCKTCRLAFPRYRELLAHFQEQTHISKASSKSQPAESQPSTSKLSVAANSIDNSPRKVSGKTDMAVCCSEMQLESSASADTAASEDASVKSQPAKDQSSISELSAGTNIADNSPQKVIENKCSEKPNMTAAYSQKRLESSMGTDTAASEDTSIKSQPAEDLSSISELSANIVANTSQKVIENKLPEQTDMTVCFEKQLESSTRAGTAASEDACVKSQLAKDQSSLSELSAGTNIVDNSTQVIENKLAEKPNVAAACSEKQEESSTRADTVASEGTSSSVSLFCQICSLVFLTTVHYRAHCRLAHGEKKYPCQKCDSGFDYLGKFRAHMRTVHPIPKIKKKKKKSEKLIKPKVAPRLDPVKLDKLLKARVKEAMKKSKRRLPEAAKKSRDRNRPKSFIID